MWKVLLAIAAVVLCGAAYLGFENKKSLEFLHADRVKWEKDVVALKLDLENTIAELKKEEEATLKKFYLEGDRVRLQPANSQMDPIYCAADNVEVRGKVVSVIRKF